MFKNKHLKAILVGGTIFGFAGAFLGFMTGLTLEGGLVGFAMGWILGEIVGVATSDDD